MSEHERDEERRSEAVARMRLLRESQRRESDTSEEEQSAASTDRVRLLRQATYQARQESDQSGPLPALNALRQWEEEQASAWRARVRAAWSRWGRRTRNAVVFAIVLVLAGQVAARPDPTGALTELRNRLRSTEARLQARQGELELVRLEMARLNTVLENSRRYGIPADLAADIHDIALAEGIDPALAFRLVRVESGFTRRAISPKGAVGLAQVMPATARDMDPTIRYEQLFDRQTNLRLGFRYLRLMLEKYDGDMRLALLAYNRGPGTVDTIRRQGLDPANGYARAVLKSGH